MPNVKKQFEEDGYVICKGLIPLNLIDEAFKQLNELLDHTLKLHHADGSKLKTTNEKYLYLRDHFPGIKKNTYNIMKHLDSLHYIANLKAITDTIKSITNSLVFVDNTQFRIDDASNDFVLPLHQEAFGCISYNAITAWIPLIDIDATTGGIKFVKGSHKNGFVKHGFKKDYHAIDDAIVAKIKQEEIPAFKVGDALFFDSKLFHASNPMTNKDGIRWTIVSRYNPITGVPFLENETAPLRTEKIDNTR